MTQQMVQQGRVAVQTWTDSQTCDKQQIDALRVLYAYT